MKCRQLHMAFHFSHPFRKFRYRISTMPHEDLLPIIYARRLRTQGHGHALYTPESVHSKTLRCGSLGFFDDKDRWCSLGSIKDTDTIEPYENDLQIEPAYEPADYHLICSENIKKIDFDIKASFE